jgi:mRNA-degrading endonuclease RelE of RelBE toxin-antitoxin system
LADLRVTDPDSADLILALLQEAKVNQSALESLSIRDFGAARNQRFSVDMWVAQQNRGRNIWRLKIWELEELGIRYRVIYAFDPRISRYYVLGVFHRDFDYDESDSRTQRVVASYEQLGIPDYS